MSYPTTNQAEKKSGTRIKSKLLSLLAIVAVFPMAILVAALAAGVYLQFAMLAAIVAQVVGLAFGYSMMAGIVNQTSIINRTLVNINNGDFEARAATLTNDELGQVAIALNTMCDNSLNLIQSNEERDQVQTSIENLISEMQEIAAGDLTITASAEQDDMTRAIAESVNQMTRQLCSIVQQVQTAAGHVTMLSTRIQESSTAMSNDRDMQASRIVEASSQLLDMTGSFQDVAALIEESVQVAIEARETASKGLKAVSDTVDGMQRIRNQVRSTSKRIKRFGESSQEIGEIVQLISDITDRTSILALNASIQAAMAGDAGQGFAVVAEEIERLAESSKDATKQISKLVRAIQNETSEVISDMEEATREVVAGSQLANQAGEMLFEIDSVSNQLVDLIQTSSTSVLQQADSTTQIANSMTEISQTTKASAENSREATQSASQLADMVGQLRGSVSQFRTVEDPDYPEFGQSVEVYDDARPPVEAIDSRLIDEFLAASQQLNNTNQIERVEEERVSPVNPEVRQACITERTSSKKCNTLVVGSSKTKSEPDSNTATFDSIEDRLLRQVREATVLLEGEEASDQGNDNQGNQDVQNAPVKRSSRRDFDPTIMMDDM